MSQSGSTRQLIQLCAGYFAFYVLTGVMVKYFTSLREPPIAQMSYLFYNTLGAALFAILVVLVLRWFRLQSNQVVVWMGMRVPSEIKYIIPSGICTAVVIPTTTLMYTLPISVMVAMVIMRGSVIVISRIVDALQIRQGILKKRVYAEENWAVLFAILAVATNVLLVPLVGVLERAGIQAGQWLGVSTSEAAGSFDFLGNAAAMTILLSYVVAYSLRIYIMNYFKNTRAKGVEQDNKGFFAVEQIAAFTTMVLAGLFVLASPDLLGWTDQRIMDFRAAAATPHAAAYLSGLPFGIVAFFSVFLFLFKGRTATFAGLVNRLTSLVAGTTATLILYFMFGTRFPSARDWLSLVFILVAVYFLTRAEKRRVVELKANNVEAAPAPLEAPRRAATGGAAGGE